MHVVVGILVRHGRDFVQLGAAQPQQVLLFLALRVGDDDHRAVAACVAYQREADAGVAGGAFDDHAAGLERPSLLGVEDDVERGAVLHRAARVQELGLAEDAAAGDLRRAAQPDERRIADGADEAVSDLRVQDSGQCLKAARRAARRGTPRCRLPAAARSRCPSAPRSGFRRRTWLSPAPS